MKNLVVFFTVTAVLALIGVLCYTYLEIADSTRWVHPSREARGNPYLALERWLSGRGIPVRTLPGGAADTVLLGPEKIVFVSSSCFEWEDESVEDYLLTSWVKAGGRLIISIDTYYSVWRLSAYLESLGIAEYNENYDNENDDAENDEAGNDGGNAGGEGEENTGEEIIAEEDTEQADDTLQENELLIDYDSLPSLDYGTKLIVSGKSEDVDRVSVIRDYVYHSFDDSRPAAGPALLVYLEMGAGSITVTGNPYFLYNGALRSEPNANLAGALFPEDQAENGVLFIRKRPGEKHLFGSLAERGNTLGIVVSSIVLLVIGFWMVIPLFGRGRPVPALPGKPLRERFLAEGRFLFAYNGLEKYLSAYETELERRLRGVTEKKPEPAGKKLSLRQFMQRQKQYMEKLAVEPPVNSAEPTARVENT